MKLAIAVCLVAVGCGGKKEGDKPAGDKAKKVEPLSGYCMLEDQSCWEFSADEVKSRGPAFMFAMCDKRGKFVENQPCPKENLVASCRAGSVLTRYYSTQREGNCGACPDG